MMGKLAELEPLDLLDAAHDARNLVTLACDFVTLADDAAGGAGTSTTKPGTLDALSGVLQDAADVMGELLSRLHVGDDGQITTGRGD